MIFYSAIMAEDWGAVDDAAPVVVAPEVQDIKLFGKWSTDDVQVSDISLTVSALIITITFLLWLCMESPFGGLFSLNF